MSVTLRSEASYQDFFLPHPVEAKYVKFVFTANGPGGDIGALDINPNVFSDRAVSVGEIEIYEPSMQGAELQVIINRFSQVLDELKRMHDNGTPVTAPVHPVVTAPSKPTPKKTTAIAKPKTQSKSTTLVHAPLKKNNASEQRDTAPAIILASAT